MFKRAVLVLRTKITLINDNLQINPPTKTNGTENVTEKKCDKKCDIFVTKPLVQKMSHFFISAYHFPLLIRCDCIIIARLVILQLPSVIPACRRLFLVIPTSSSVNTSKMAEMEPK